MKKNPEIIINGFHSEIPDNIPKRGDMKFLIFFLILFLIGLSSCFSKNHVFNETLYFPPIYKLYFMYNGKGLLYIDEEKFNFDYEVEINNGLIFITLKDDSFTSLFARENFSKCLILQGSIVGIDNPRLKNFSFGFCNKTNDWGNKGCVISPVKEDSVLGSTQKTFSDVTSYLIEKSNSYKIENLNNYSPDTPWVENAPGNGIGEGFTIVDTCGHKFSYLLLMNGYISFDKPYLYSQNGRIKKLKITSCNSRVTKVVDVLDTPHPQTVDISFLPEADDIRIEIADVYPGTKYQDTCLNFCQLVDCEIKPKFDKPINSSMK